MQLASGRVLVLSLALRARLASLCFFWRRDFAWQGARTCHSQEGTIFLSWLTCLRVSGALLLQEFEAFCSRFCFGRLGLPHNVSAMWPIIEGQMECLTCLSEGWTFSPPSAVWFSRSASAATLRSDPCISQLQRVRSGAERLHWQSPSDRRLIWRCKLKAGWFFEGIALVFPRAPLLLARWRGRGLPRRLTVKDDHYLIGGIVTGDYLVPAKWGNLSRQILYSKLPAGWPKHLTDLKKIMLLKQCWVLSIFLYVVGPGTRGLGV